MDCNHSTGKSWFRPSASVISDTAFFHSFFFFVFLHCIVGWLFSVFMWHINFSQCIMLFQRCRTAINIWKRWVPVVRDHILDLFHPQSTTVPCQDRQWVLIFRRCLLWQGSYHILCSLNAHIDARPHLMCDEIKVLAEELTATIWPSSM